MVLPAKLLTDPPHLAELIRKSREYVDSLTPEQLKEMLRKQGEGWAKAETQWAKDFREGKCKRD